MMLAKVFILVMILIFGVLLLREDARLKRVKRQVAVALAPRDKPAIEFAESVRRHRRFEKAISSVLC